MSSSPALKVNKNYTYNAETGKYVFHTEKRFGKNFVFQKHKIDQIVQLYSKVTGNMTANEISLKMRIPVDVVKFILRVMNITHDTIPYTDEAIVDRDEDEMVEDALALKKFNVLQKIEKKDWKSTQEDAESWRMMKIQQLDPFGEILDAWIPPKYYPVANKKQAKKNKKDTLIVGLSDWHYGLVAHERYLYNQKEWNIEETKRSVENYGNQIQQEILNNDYKEIKLCMLGDMSHTLSGFTDKGTKLEAHPIEEEQLDVAFDSLVIFVQKILEASSNVTVVSCSGNHSALGDYVLAKMLSLYFAKEKKIKFDITNKRFISFKIAENMFLMEHGYSSVAKDRLPNAPKAREAYINNWFLAKPELMEGVKRKYYLSADQHHSESYEMTHVEGFMFPTLVAGCRHADNSGYNSRARQTALVVNDDLGVTSQKYFYFD